MIEVFILWKVLCKYWVLFLSNLNIHLLFYFEFVGGDEVDEQTQEEIFEEKLREAIDGINQKSAQGRTASLESVAKAFIKKFIPEFVTDR